MTGLTVHHAGQLPGSRASEKWVSGGCRGQTGMKNALMLLGE